MKVHIYVPESNYLGMNKKSYIYMYVYIYVCMYYTKTQWALQSLSIV
jgi:hypothetical protein